MKLRDWIGKHRGLLAIVVAATALRFYGIGSESLWLDEAQTAKWAASKASFLITIWTQGQLFLFLMKGWCSLFGYSELALRFLPAIFGILGVAAIYVLGTTLFGKTAGWCAALLLAVNPYAVYYAQEGRPYTLYLLCALLAVTFVVRWAQTGEWRFAAGAAISNLALLYTHSYAPFLIAAQIAIYFIYRPSRVVVRPSSRRSIMLLGGATILLALPQFWFYAQRFFLKATTDQVAAWITEPSFGELLSTINRFFVHPAAGFVTIGLALALVLVHIRSLWHDRRAFLSLTIILLCVWLVPWLISKTTTPIYVRRYTIPALIPVLLVLAWGLSRLRTSWRNALLVMLMIMTALPLYYLYRYVDNDPWRQTADLVRSVLRAGDHLLFHQGLISVPFNYYAQSPEGANSYPLSDLRDVTAAATGTDRLWLICAYENKDRAFSSDVARLLGPGWQMEREQRVNDLVRQDPWAPHIAEIKVMLFQRKNKL